ncbi:MAG: hypothetical protein QXV17_05845 [Candidatus Micrarchaeaceae archaeon]
MNECQANGYIDDISVKYNSKMEGYTNISSNMKELSEIRLGRLAKDLKTNKKYYNRR